MTVEATISVPAFHPEQSVILAPRNLDTVILQVPASGPGTAALGTRGATVVRLRVIDAAPLRAWED